MIIFVRQPTLTELKRWRKVGHCLFCRIRLKLKGPSDRGRPSLICESSACDRDYRIANNRDYEAGIFQPTKLDKKRAAKMALNDEQEKELRNELESLRKTHAETTEAIKQQKATDTEEARKAKAKGEKPGKVELDPDLVKEVAEQKERIAKLEKKLGGTGGDLGSFDMLNFFGDE